MPRGGQIAHCIEEKAKAHEPLDERSVLPRGRVIHVVLCLKFLPPHLIHELVWSFLFHHLDFAGTLRPTLALFECSRDRLRHVTSAQIKALRGITLPILTKIA